MNERASVSVSGVVVLGLTALYLADLFLPWQRVCFSGAFLDRVISACLSGSAFQASAAGVGIVSGVVSAALIVWLALEAAGVSLVPGWEDVVERGLSWGVVGSGAVKWIAVIGKAAAVGAFLGLGLLISIAVAATVRMQTPRPVVPTTPTPSPPLSGGWVNW